MKRKDSISRKTRYGILAAIMAGAFSIMPAAQAMPTGGASGTATITQNQSGTTMDIASTVTNNLLTWQDFSIAQGETVNFAGANNYLNVVLGSSRSDILGSITGSQANVWLVNPNGILVGDGATINVGSLHLSTAEIDGSKLTDYQTAMDALTPVTTFSGDVVNKGILTAAKDITVEGDNVTFKNVANVTAGTTLTVKAASTDAFHVGRTDDSTLTLADGSTEPTYYKLISTAEELQNINNDLSGNYMLAKDIDLAGVDFKPIGQAGNQEDYIYSGKFDGLGHVIKNLTINVDNYKCVGLFAVLTGTVENLGLKDGSINATGTYARFVGSIAGSTQNGTAVIQNVYNDSVSVTSKDAAGGLVGAFRGGKILNAYNTGDVTSTTNGGNIWAGGIVATTGWNQPATIKNVYNTGTVSANGQPAGGIVGYLNDSRDKIENAYNTGAVSNNTASNVGGIVGNKANGTVTNAFYTQGGGSSGTLVSEVDMKKAATFSSWGTAISSDGVDRSAVWRICEDVSMPMLTAFMTRKDKVTETVYDGTYDAGYVISSEASTQTSAQDGMNWVKDVNAVVAKPITVSFADISKVYDGTTTATAGAGTLNGVVDKDKESIGVTAEAAYDQKNAGPRTVNYTKVTLTGENAIRNYNLADKATGTGTITAAPLTVTVTDASKQYDGTTSVTDGAYTVTTGQTYGTDALTGGTYAYADKNAGTGKTVSLTGVTVNDGNEGKNYDLTFVNSTNSTITAAPLSLAVVDTSKQYDGTTDVADGQYAMRGTLYGTDTLNGGTYAYDDKNVGTGKTVSLTGVAVNDGNEGKNYELTVVNSTNSTITAVPLSLAVIDTSKQYDGTTDVADGQYAMRGTLYGTDSLSGGTYAYADKNAGTGKTVSLTGVTVNDGNEGRNYDLTIVNSTNSTITAAPLSLAVTDASKQYDGTTEVTDGQYAMRGTLYGADSLSGGTYAYADKNAGTGKTVSLTGVTVNDGNEGKNYDLTIVNSTNSTITAAPLTLTVVDYTKEYDGTTAAPGATYKVTTGQLFGEDSLTGGNFVFDNKNPGTGKTLTLSGVVVSDGNAGQNYTLTYVGSTNSSITANAPEAVVSVIEDKLEEAGSSLPKVEAEIAAAEPAPAAQNNNQQGEAVETAATTATTHGDKPAEGNVPAGEKQVTHNAFDSDGILTLENEGINPPESMSAESVAQQQEEKNK